MNRTEFIGTNLYYSQEFVDDRNKLIEELQEKIDRTVFWLDRTIEIIKQQPSEDDTFILERLKSIKYCLVGDE